MLEAARMEILESVVVAGLMGYRVIHVDYRMLPDHPVSSGNR